MKPVAQAQENRQSLIDGSRLFLTKFAQYAPDSPLVDGSQMVDQREGREHRAKGGRRERVAADFLIGAHAQLHAGRP